MNSARPIVHGKNVAQTKIFSYLFLPLGEGCVSNSETVLGLINFENKAVIGHVSSFKFASRFFLEGKQEVIVVSQ